MRQVALGLLAGCCTMLLLPELPDANTLAWCGLGSVLMAIVLRQPALIAAMLGLFLCWQELGSSLADRLAPALEGEELTLEGIVVSIPRPAGEGIRFVFEPNGTTAGIPRRIQLSWYDHQWVPAPTETLVLIVRMRRPRGFANPGGSDYAANLLLRGIGATGYIRSAVRLGRDPSAVRAHPVLLARSALAERIMVSLGDRPATGIVLGLSVGLKGWVSREQWETLSRSGTSHLMAISGMHIGTVAGLVALLAGALQRRRQARGSMRSRRDVAMAAGAIAAAIYSSLAGWALPAQRALVMIAVATIALSTRRNAGAANGLAVALSAVLLLQPLAPLSVGFWLSFAAVACLLYATGGYLRPVGRARGFLMTQAAVTVGLVPILVAGFGQLSLVAVLVNLLAIPLYSIVIVPLVLLATLAIVVYEPIGNGLLAASAGLIEMSWYLLDFASRWQLARLAVPGLPLALWPVFGLGTLAALSPLPWRGRLAGLLIVTLACAWRPPPPLPGALRFALLDVGQGLAAVVQTREHVLVYDAGPTFRSGGDAAASVIAPYLAHRGVGRLDMLVISHDDNDHSGGAETLLRRFAVRRLVSSGAVTGLPQQPEVCVAGGAWQWDGVSFEWLHPGGKLLKKDNDRSCVLLVRTSNHSILLTGDIESRAERQMLARVTPRQVDLVVAPHHGSKTSSSAGLVAATHPKWVLYAVGHQNRWGFPAESIVRRWATAGVQSLATDSAGAIELELLPGQEFPQPRSWRDSHRRPWLGP
jgi:competence protein ComEC